MNIKSIKRIAARILEVGENKVLLNPFRLDEIKEAITNQDIITLIKDNAISTRTEIGRKKRKIKKRKRGTGKIKKKIKRRKKTYIKKIRKLRGFIRLLKENLIITSKEANKLRLLSKSGQFKSQRHLKEHIAGIMKKDISKLEKK